MMASTVKNDIACFRKGNQLKRNSLFFIPLTVFSTTGTFTLFCQRCHGDFLITPGDLNGTLVLSFDSCTLLCVSQCRDPKRWRLSMKGDL